MTSRRTISFALMLIAVVSIFALVWRAIAPREPTYQDKPLSYWLDEGYGDGTWSEVGEDNAHQAIRAAGTNAIPILLLDIQAKDSKLVEGIHYLMKNLQIERRRYVSASSKHQEAEVGFFTLGAKAKIAVPALMVICKQPTSGESERCAIDCLGDIGPEAKAAIPILLAALTNSNLDLNLSAANALGNIHAEPDLVVPALVDCLHAQKKEVRFVAAAALIRFGAQGKAAAPMLIKILNDTNEAKSERQEAKEVIEKIAPEEAAKIPPKVFKALE